MVASHQRYASSCKEEVKAQRSERQCVQATAWCGAGAGATYVIEVVEGGFAYDGRTFASLSEIARLITGTRWSGPRFFGLVP